MNVKNETLGISSGDVAKCNDVATLKKWLVSLEAHITEVAGQIASAKAKVHQVDGGYSDSDWFQRASQYKRVQGVLKFQIGIRLSELKKQRQASVDRIESSFWKQKVEELAPELMMVFYAELDEILNKEKEK